MVGRRFYKLLNSIINLAGLQPQNVRINEFVSLQHKKPQWENLESMTENDSEQSLNKLLNSLNSIDNTYAAGLSGGRIRRTRNISL